MANARYIQAGQRRAHLEASDTKDSPMENRRTGRPPQPIGPGAPRLSESELRGRRDEPVECWRISEGGVLDGRYEEKG